MRNVASFGSPFRVQRSSSCALFRQRRRTFPPSMRRSPSTFAQVLTAGLLAAAVAVAALTAHKGNWDLETAGMLLVFAVASDQMAMRIRSSRVQVSGSFLAIVVAVVLLGGTPAVLIALLTITIGGLRGREARRFLLPNLANYAAFPVIAGLVFA